MRGVGQCIKTGQSGQNCVQTKETGLFTKNRSGSKTKSSVKHKNVAPRLGSYEVSKTPKSGTDLCLSQVRSPSLGFCIEPFVLSPSPPVLLPQLEDRHLQLLAWCILGGVVLVSAILWHGRGKRTTPL